jgi:hypothetical protein
MEKNEMGGECGMYGEEERCKQVLLRETWRVKQNLEDLGVDGRVILK